MQNSQRAATLAVAVVLAGAMQAAGQAIHKEVRFTVGPKASVTVNNQYGSISVRAAAGNQVVVSAVLASDKVEIDQDTTKDRVDLISHLLAGSDAQNGRVDYEISVPPDARVSLHSSTGPLRVEKLRGDVTLEGVAGNIDVRDISNAHVHVKTLNGSVNLTNIRAGHVEITSVGGDVFLKSVDGPSVEVDSASGKIHYDGDFGDGGQYKLRSHTGDIEAMAPTYASIDVSARSEHGQVESDFPLQPKQHTSFVVKAGSAFAGTMGKAASSVKLLSFSGKIHLKKR